MSSCLKHTSDPSAASIYTNTSSRPMRGSEKSAVTGMPSVRSPRRWQISRRWGLSPISVLDSVDKTEPESLLGVRPDVLALPDARQFRLGQRAFGAEQLDEPPLELL